MRIGQADLDTRRPIKHPCGNLQPTVRIGTDNIAPEHHAIRLIDRRMNRDRKTKPRMEAVEQFPKLCPVGVLKPRCTTPCVPILGLAADAGHLPQPILDPRHRAPQWPGALARSRTHRINNNTTSLCPLRGTPGVKVSAPMLIFRAPNLSA
jgi:hypothetical protein